MLITNRIKNPTIEFKRLNTGDVFMTLAGDVYIKLGSPNTWKVPSDRDNSFCLNSSSKMLIEDDLQVVPLETELLIKRNCHELYSR